MFYSKIPKPYTFLLIILCGIINVFTFGLIINQTLDIFIHHNYYLNRRILLKYLNTENLSFAKTKLNFLNITEYKFEKFIIWVYENNLELALFYNEDILIWLHTISNREKLIVIEIIKKLNALK